MDRPTGGGEGRTRRALLRGVASQKIGLGLSSGTSRGYGRLSDGRAAGTMSGPDELQLRIYPLLCPGCGHVSHKHLLELIHSARLPCDSCRRSVTIAGEYGKPRLEEILIGLGRRGFAIPDNKKLD